MTTDATNVKCRTDEDYNEAPFFFVEPDGDTPYAVCWLPDPLRLHEAALALMREWPKGLELHFEAPVDGEWGDDAMDLFGDVSRPNLERALAAHPEVAFRDGGVRIRVWRKDNQDCIGLDEHGLLFYWTRPYLARAALAALGIEERKAPLIQEKEHWHSDPRNAAASREAFVNALEIE